MLKVYHKLTAAELHESRLNILLLGVVILLAVGLISIWSKPGRFPVLEADGPSKARQTFAKKVLPSRASYNTIVENDIFRPSRKRFVAQAEGTGSRRVMTKRPNLVLLGTVILDDYKAAMMSEKNKVDSTRYFKVGDSIGGFIIKDIGKDSVSIQRGSEVATIKMNEPAKRHPRETRKKRVRDLSTTSR